jgi:hypothetical protein
MGQPGYDPQFKIWPVIDKSQNFRMSTHRKNNCPPKRQYAHFEGVYSFEFISKEILTSIG